MHIYCDFDGTISLKDTTDAVLSRFASPEWQVIESQWERGDIGSADCMKQQIGLISAPKAELDTMLDDFPIDPAFIPFVKFCQSKALPITILSDGVDYFIHRILKRYHLEHLNVIANQLHMTSESTYSLSTPHHNLLCSTRAGVCKCQQMDGKPTSSIFIGDGRSDFCGAGKADVVFAKSSLTSYCEQQKISFYPYQDFNDIKTELNQLLITRPVRPTRREEALQPHYIL